MNDRTAVVAGKDPFPDMSAGSASSDGAGRRRGRGAIRLRRQGLHPQALSESLLRLFLQAADPKKYGARPGFTRKRLMAWERKRLKREVEAEVRAKLRPRSFDEVRDSIMRKVEAIRRHSEPAKLAAGWQRDEEGRWIPPGWVRAVPDAETPRDSL